MKGKYQVVTLWINIISICSAIIPHIEWLKIVEGSVLSMGQVYAVQVTPGVSDSRLQIMYAGPGDQSAHVAGSVPLQPPPSPPVSAGGSAGNCSSFIVPRYNILPIQSKYQCIAAPGDLSSVYSGLWGYSCILSMAAVSWAQFPFSP